ncbi:MAG TPA: restriction endonuclease subunit S [Sedimentisphaerales bacterium]|nr:restriction endonuclease subunit S [Sedimentisphaerales bacterium]
MTGVTLGTWESHKLDQLGFVGRGRSRHRPRNAPSLYGGRYPFFQTGDIKAAGLYLYNYSQTYNETGLAQSKLWEPGTLCITIAANIAETAILKIRGCFPDSVVGFVPHPEKADVRFVKYYIDLIKLRMQSISRGTTQDNLSVDKLLTFDFVVPRIEMQRKIASILSAYDDLIENNSRRIKILEEMAQAIYREWFVNFRFPGHEKVKMVDSELGMIPEGWEVKRLGDVLETLESGSRPKGGIDPTVTEVPSVGAENVLGLGKYDYSKEKFVTREFYEGMRKGYIRSRDVLLYKDGAKLGRKSMFMDGFPHDECCINEHAFILRTNDLCSQAYLYFWLDLPKVTRDIINLNANAAQPGINQKSVKSLTILLADVMLKRRFDEIAFPVLTELFNLAKKNQTLRQTRDLLLPKLISGQVDVSELDIEIKG